MLCGLVPGAMARGATIGLVALALCIALGAQNAAADAVSQKLALLEAELKLQKLRGSMGGSVCSSDDDCGEDKSCFNGRCVSHGSAASAPGASNNGHGSSGAGSKDDDDSGSDDDDDKGSASTAPGAATESTAGGCASDNVRECRYDRECNNVHCPGCSCDRCGHCQCSAPFSGAFCTEQATSTAAPKTTANCAAGAPAPVCKVDRDCNADNCEGCTCGACGACSCAQGWAGATCRGHTREYYKNKREEQGLPSCSVQGDCNSACNGCKCLVTGECSCALNFHGQFCGQKRRAKKAGVALWERQCQVRQDCNWPTCLDCKCGKDFKCQCGDASFSGPTCGKGASEGSTSAAAAAATSPPTPAPTPEPAPTPVPGPHTTPWPTPMFSCRSQGDCNFPLCASCSCYHGGCKCGEGWTGPFCNARAKKPTPKPTATPTAGAKKAARKKKRARPAHELACTYDIDCLLAPGATCVDGGCKCPKGTHGARCETAARAARRHRAATQAPASTSAPPTPQPTPFVPLPGKDPCFHPGDCNFAATGSRCVNHYCDCRGGWTGDFCDTPPAGFNAAAAAARRHRHSHHSHGGGPTPHPTPALGCSEDGDCNNVHCPGCHCHWGGCRCAEPYSGPFCEERLVPAVPKRVAKQLTLAQVQAQMAALREELLKEAQPTPAPSAAAPRVSAAATGALARTDMAADDAFAALAGGKPSPEEAAVAPRMRAPQPEFHPHPHLGRYDHGTVRGMGMGNGVGSGAGMGTGAVRGEDRGAHGGTAAAPWGGARVQAETQRAEQQARREWAPQPENQESINSLFSHLTKVSPRNAGGG